MSENVVPITAAKRRRSARRKPIVPAGAPLLPLIDSWQLALEAANKASNTILGYTRSAHKLLAWLEENGHPTDAEGVQAEHVRGFLAAEHARVKPASVATDYRNLKVWWNWVIAEDERTDSPNPVKKEDTPTVARKAKKYLTVEEIRALLATCRGNDFESRRDAAIIRVLADNGMRVGGLVSIRLDNVDLRAGTITIVLKGGDELLAPIGKNTAKAIDRYLRVRPGHSSADSPWLWLGVGSIGRQRLREDGVRGILQRRGEEAGIAELVHPHRFRAYVTHELLAANASDGDTMKIMGWRSATMIPVYAGDLAAERARETHARLSPGDRI